MIEVKNVTKEFGPFTAVRDVSFTVAKGEVLGLLGPNGAGKTTTMRVLTGFIPPTAGTAVVGGYDILDQPLEAKRRIGYLPETPPLYAEMTVVDYLDFVARIKGITADRRRESIDTAVERCAVGDVRDKLIGKLSKGYRQRVGLAQALVHEPDVLVLDEPTAGLDPKQINETRDLVKSLAGEHTIILSTHILPEVSMTCDRVVIINRGQVVAEDSPVGLTKRLAGGSIICLTVEGDEANVREALGAVEGVSAVDVGRRDAEAITYKVEATEGHDPRRELARAVVERGFGLIELGQIGMSLEDIFLELTTEEPSEAAGPSVQRVKEEEGGEGLADAEEGND